jgi:hypothetical protein
VLLQGFFFAALSLCERLSQPALAIFQPASAVLYACVDIGAHSVHIQEV